MKKRLPRSVDAHKVKMKARVIRRDFQTEREVTIIPAGTIVEWAGQRADYIGVNVNWNAEMYAIPKTDWDGAENVDGPDSE